MIEQFATRPGLQRALPQTPETCAWRIDRACTLRLPASGCLQVLTGQAWITRRGDATDHVLQRGQGTPVRRGERLVVEPWHRGQPVQLRLLTGTAAAASRPPVHGGPCWPTIAG